MGVRMSELDKKFIKRVLVDSDIAKYYKAISGITSEMLIDSDVNLYNFVDNYVVKYSRMPTVDFVEESTGIVLAIDADGDSLFYSDEIKKRYLFQYLSENIKGVAGKLRVGDVDTAYDIMEKAYFEIRKKEFMGYKIKSIFSYSDKVKDRYRRVKEGMVVGVPSPWEEFDRVTCGWQSGDFVVIQARPGVGKTWFLLHLASAAWKVGCKVLFVSLEVDDVVLATRFLSAEFKVPYADIRKGALGTAVEERFFKGIDKYVKNDDDRFVVMGGGFGNKIDQVEAAIIEQAPDIVFIDGVYLLQVGVYGRERHEKLAEVADQIAIMKKKYGIPILVTHQFNRNVKVDSLKGSLDDSGMSDGFSRNADWMIGLFRDKDLETNKKLLVRFLKTREADKAEIKLNWDFGDMDFSVYNPMAPSGGYTGNASSDDDDEVVF
jgi:replicative DNA helicase